MINISLTEELLRLDNHIGADEIVMDQGHCRLVVIDLIVVHFCINAKVSNSKHGRITQITY